VNIKKLRPKQQRFVEEYVIDWNGTQAAIRAGYSERSARVTASRLLTKANVKVAIERIKEELRSACYSSAVESVLKDRVVLSGVDQSSVDQPLRLEEDGFFHLQGGIEVHRTEANGVEEIEYRFPNRPEAIDRLLRLVE